MENMRNFMQSWMGKAVLVLTLIPMAFLGVQSFSGGSNIKADEIVKVGEVSISLNTFQSEIKDYHTRLLEKVDASLINDKALNDEVLKNMIDRALLENQAKFFGMKVSDDVITRLVQQDPTFHDANGQFSGDMFTQFLTQRGMTKDMLFNVYRTQINLRQLTSSILSTAIYPNNQISRLLDLQAQSREAWVLRYDWHDFANQVSVDNAEVEAYYQANQDKMIDPARVDLAYIELNPSDVKVEAPTEEEIKVQYQSYLQTSGKASGRELAHILLTGNDAQNRAKEIKAKLDAGESFETLAKQYSDDPTGKDGGKIGTYNPAVFGDSAPAVESAIGGLKVGQASEPVKTNFGYQIFKVVSMKDVPTLDSMKDELTEQVKQRKQANALNDIITKINGMAGNGAGIADIAKEVNLPAKNIAGYPQENNTSALPEPVVIAAAFDEFTISEQAVSPNITLSDKTVWVQPTNYQAQKQLSLAEATERIKLIITQQKATKLALETANKRISELADPKALIGSAVSLGMVTRQSPNLMPAERSSLFLHNSGDKMDLWAVETETGASLMIGSPVINTTIDQIPLAQRQKTATIMRDNVGQDYFEDYLQYLRDTHKVQINEQAMSGR